MPVKGGDQVRANYRKTVGRITANVTKSTLAKVLTAGLSYSDEIAPIEYGTLINSKFKTITKTPTGWRGEAGYTVNYALYLHGTDSYTPMWNPRPPEQKKGPAWNPIATPRFLELGFTGIESGPAIQRIIEEGYRKR